VFSKYINGRGDKISLSLQENFFKNLVLHLWVLAILNKFLSIT
jgi:hypothetical protein